MEVKEVDIHHPHPSFTHDYNLITRVLLDEEVFIPLTGRQHSTFNFKSGLLAAYNYTELLKWLKQKVDNFMVYT